MGTSTSSLGGIRTFTVTSCGYNRLFSNISSNASEKKYLDNRYVPAFATCANGTSPTTSAAAGCRPCLRIKPGCGYSCVANYCGGCHSEYYDDGGNAQCHDCGSGTLPPISDVAVRSENDARMASRSTMSTCSTPGYVCSAEGNCRN
eukprot:TRINITY_DN5171_c0_g2_i1.p1 TRINITY_DN5171_c0_g2~~TRINITY_DN5171_c0_g2_i1.p1  ORF type:complete len:147 (+),score=13.35 TRINITY_DN5171_c0_g2_i1:487-927(+)